MKNNVKKLVSPDNGLGRTVRTALQALVGITAWTYGLLTVPGVQDYLTHNNVVAIGSLVGVVAAVTAVHNGASHLLKLLFGED